MGDLGFWALAQEDPDYLALVTPDGDEMRAGELLGRANQLVHALRAQGLVVGDVVATLLPNSAEMIELYLAALQAGWYLVPINFHLVAPEVAYILKDSGAKAFVSHERFADVAAAAANATARPMPPPPPVTATTLPSRNPAIVDSPALHATVRPAVPAGPPAPNQRGGTPKLPLVSTRSSLQGRGLPFAPPPRETSKETADG